MIRRIWNKCLDVLSIAFTAPVFGCGVAALYVGRFLRCAGKSLIALAIALRWHDRTVGEVLADIEKW